MRPSKHETWLLVAHAVSGQGTCRRRRVGCVLVDDAGCVLSTGYNGPGPGQAHCIDTPCAGAQLQSGTGLEACEAIHAEQNALMTCADVRKVHTIYVTTSPCIHCTKMLLRTGAKFLYYIDEYPNNGRELWERADRYWTQFHSPLIQVLRLLSHGAPVSSDFGEIIAESSVRVN